jgi:outer membrane receptor for ferrienterochelin and colicins
MAMRPGDISMLLNEMGGMRVQTTSPVGASSVRVQGMRGRYAAFYPTGCLFLDSKARASGCCRLRPWIWDRSK